MASEGVVVAPLPMGAVRKGTLGLGWVFGSGHYLPSVLMDLLVGFSRGCGYCSGPGRCGRSWPTRWRRR